MKIKQVFIAGIGVLAFSLLNVAQADDLLQVYNQALHDDPTFKQAQSTWWSAKQNLPIAVSAYLPQISLLNTYERVYASTNPPAANGMGWHTQNVLTLTATQAIFDYSAWTNIREQAASVKSATATYLASIQDLMSRTASAYFSVLQAYDQLSLTIAQKKAVKRQLVTAQQKFKVGLIAITGVYDAQSSYDTKNADEISDRNSLYNALENLRAITGQHYLTLQGVRVQVPLVRPIPDNINIWVATAQRQNYSLESANYTTIQQHENILNQAAAYMPTLDATTSYADTRNWNYQNGFGGGAKANRITQAGDYGLSLAWTPFQGGKTFYSIRQARADYLTALGKLESTHRDVINQTRQAFLGVSSGISRIRADRQAIVSTRNALKATE
ncbi:MAG: channel protein TolC, partial [Coxiella sp. (in: Bacteria)]